MKRPRQFVPLLAQMLGFYRYGTWPLLIYLCLSGAVLLVSAIFMPMGWMEAHGRQTAWGEELIWSWGLWWFFLMTVSTPLPFLVLGGNLPLEFLFTRAVDRRVWLRTERVAVIIIGLGPLLLNLLFASLGPRLAFEPAAAGSSAAAMQQRYLQVFPGSQVTAADAGHSEQLVIRHGAEMFAGWMVWFGLVCLFLVAAYFSCTFRAWQRAGWHHSRSRLRPWLGAVMVNAPTYAPMVLVVLLTALRVNVLEESFLLFSTHPVLMSLAVIALACAVQHVSERNIRKLEFEFT